MTAVSRVGGGEIGPDEIDAIQNGNDLYICRACGEWTNAAEDCCGAGPKCADADLDLER